MNEDEIPIGFDEMPPETEDEKPVSIPVSLPDIEITGGTTGAGTKETPGTITGRFDIKKSDEDRHLAFGWAYVSQDTAGQQMEDWSGDQLAPEELESAAYQFVKLYREGGEMHERGGCAVLVESMVFTQEKQAALGIPEGILPVGWWIGFEVTDPDVWARVKDGTYPMFSIEGKAIREELG